jgi:PEP-CTERM motif
MSIMTRGRKFFSAAERHMPGELNRCVLRAALACFIGATLIAGTAHAGSFSPSPTCEDLASGGNPSCVNAAVESLFLGSYSIGNTFNSATGVTPLYGGGPGFVDAYLFSVSNSDADALAATITLGGAFSINGLSVRLYGLADNTPASNSSTAGLVLPADTSPNGFFVSGTTTVSNVDGATATTAAIEPTMLAAGQYALEVWGTVAGQEGGSYSGTLNLAPVPLPGTFILALSGLALFGALAPRCRRVGGRPTRLV